MKMSLLVMIPVCGSLHKVSTSAQSILCCHWKFPYFRFRCIVFILILMVFLVVMLAFC